jgi:putative transcriptional regulator
MFEETTKNRIARWIAGDIALSSELGRTLKRWRETFGMSQTALAEALKISSSVISDYEAGRRKSPGAATIKKIVNAFLEVDEQQGGRVMRTLTHTFGTQLPPDVVLDIREFGKPVEGKKLCKAIKGDMVVNSDLLGQKLFGYTVIDSPKAVINLSAEDFMRLYGLTTERALVFTGVTTGRSPMVAIKVRGITPGVVILHGKLKKADELGKKIAENLRVPLVISRVRTVEELLERLRKVAT